MDYPRTGYILILIGSAFQAIAALFETMGLAVFYTIPAHLPVSTYVNNRTYVMMHYVPFYFAPIAFWLILAWAFVIISFIAALLVKGNPEAGGVLALLVSILALPTVWGFMIGSLLMFVDSILALTWRPSAGQQQAAPDAPEPPK